MRKACSELYCIIPRICILTYKRTIGDDRARTGNLRLAKPALSQLSYVPVPASRETLNTNF
jgi:hypothetical protein